MNYTYIAHHGIKGQKWGVRRYQNYDGTYTQKGLERYYKAKQAYDDSKNSLESAKNLYKSAELSRGDYESAKADVKTKKREMNTAYSKLKTDRMADKGKSLYAQGKTITANNAVFGVSQKVTAAGLGVTGVLLKKYGNSKPTQIAAAVTIGMTAVTGIIGIKTTQENKYLRAYYARSR